MIDAAEILRRLNEKNVPFIVIGEIAANLHGVDRVTKDLDLTSPLDHANVIQIIRALKDVRPHWFMRPDLPEIDPDSPMLSGLKNLYIRTELGRLDVLGDVPGVGTYVELEKRAVTGTLGGVPCRILDIDTLIAAKRFAGRPHDHLDAQHLTVLRDHKRKLEGGG